jgi:hypothetical protein
VTVARERRTNGTPPPDRTAGARSRPRGDETPEIDLSDEELRALADEGVDPDDVRRVARERRDALDASDHDRDTARDDLEGLVLERDEDY